MALLHHSSSNRPLSKSLFLYTHSTDLLVGAAISRMVFPVWKGGFHGWIYGTWDDGRDGDRSVLLTRDSYRLSGLGGGGE